MHADKYCSLHEDVILAFKIICGITVIHGGCYSCEIRGLKIIKFVQGKINPQTQVFSRLFPIKLNNGGVKHWQPGVTETQHGQKQMFCVWYKEVERRRGFCWSSVLNCCILQDEPFCSQSAYCGRRDETVIHRALT